MKKLLIYSCFIIVIMVNCSPMPWYIRNTYYSVSGTDSTIERFDKKGTLWAKAFYTRGSLDSLAYYYPQGQIAMIDRFCNGNYEGNSESFFSNGSLNSIVTYSGGQEVFKSRKEYDSLGAELYSWEINPDQMYVYRSHYASGEKHIEQQFKNGLCYGYKNAWRSNGSLMSKIYYKDGEYDEAKSRVLDLNGLNVSGFFKEKFSEQMRAWQAIYTKYLFKNKVGGGRAKLLISFDGQSKKVWPLVLQSEMNCKELLSDINNIMMRQDYTPISIPENEWFVFVLPLTFQPDDQNQ